MSGHDSPNMLLALFMLLIPPSPNDDEVDEDDENPVLSVTVVVVTPFASVLVRVVTVPVGVWRVLICSDVLPAGADARTADAGVRVCSGSVCNCIWRRTLSNGSADSCWRPKNGEPPMWNGSAVNCWWLGGLEACDDDDAVLNDRYGPDDTECVVLVCDVDDELDTIPDADDDDGDELSAKNLTSSGLHSPGHRWLRPA